METEVYFDCRTEEEWNTVSTIIPKGFVCVEQGDNLTRIKVGDGERTYNELPYASRDYSELYTKDELYNREEIDEKLSQKADIDHVHENASVDIGVVSSEDYCPITLDSESTDGVAMKMCNNGVEKGKIGFDQDGTFIVTQGENPYINSIEISSATNAFKTGVSGKQIYTSSGTASEKNITIENIETYAAFAINITGRGANSLEYAVNAIIPIAYLAQSTSNYFDISGGIPSGENSFAGYIRASIPSTNKLRLRIFDAGECMLTIKIVALY